MTNVVAAPLSLALLILGLSGSITTAHAVTLLPVNGGPQFVHGINMGWFDGQYDHDIGVNPLHPEWGTWYDPTKVQQYLEDANAMNANVVRIWLNENKEGLVLDGSGNVTGLDPTFVTNLDDLVARAGSVGITIYMTLNGGDSDWVTDVAKQTSYLENAVKPMAARYQGSAAIFAYDVMNEIESVVGGPDGNWGVGATWDQARAYITAASAAIRSVDPGRLITASSGWHGYANLQKGYFSGLGLDFYDCHVYDDAGFIPDAATLGLDKPVILGEHGHTGGGNNDERQNESLIYFLYNLSAGGWAGHAVWHYDYPGSTNTHRMVNADGSWRPVGFTMRDFVYLPPGTGTRPMKASALTLRDDASPPFNPNKRRMVFLSHGVLVPPWQSTGDPVDHGATLTVYDPSGAAASVVLDLPAGLWSRTGKEVKPGYRYRDPAGPIASVTLRNGKLKVRGKGGALFSLSNAPQGTMAVRLQLGSDAEACAVATTKEPASKNDTTAKFKAARNTPPPVPGTCPAVL